MAEDRKVLSCQISLRLTEDQMHLLKAESASRGCSKSDVLRAAIDKMERIGAV